VTLGLNGGKLAVIRSQLVSELFEDADPLDLLAWGDAVIAFVSSRVRGRRVLDSVSTSVGISWWNNNKENSASYDVSRDGSGRQHRRVSDSETTGFTTQVSLQSSHDANEKGDSVGAPVGSVLSSTSGGFTADIGVVWGMVVGVFGLVWSGVFF